MLSTIPWGIHKTSSSFSPSLNPTSFGYPLRPDPLPGSSRVLLSWPSSVVIHVPLNLGASSAARRVIK
ncbi:hypothetical protein L596_015199 [Steinernema carpocapsae]|uniref:Uncharacterized protein n=1 Tax=Steinernema carpocapsae TaxID=34508 RepID=A0A4U5NEA1_STECR|nr:hypothetical protein L596_015199 [Steinernema carpocapsae]